MNNLRHKLIALIVGIGFPLLVHAETVRPNIILILTDDMGYSDLGCFGSEIETPNLDRLAANGVRFTQFYNTSRCSPTRASLMTGLYPHQAGVGMLTNDEGAHNPGYRGRLNQHCRTIAEVLQPAGYRTIITGKWHLGNKDTKWLPRSRGFDFFYGCPEGGGFYFDPADFKRKRTIVRNDELVYNQSNQPPPFGWYSTDAFTKEGLTAVTQAINDNSPFFWYLAYNAPHFPLQAKRPDIEKYRGRYRSGWDEIRHQRHQRLIELGIISDAWQLPPRDPKVPAWSELSAEEQDRQDLRMATYAAMVDCIDQNIGEIITTLTQLKALNNTLIIFLHDNGGCGEGGTLGKNSGTGRCGDSDSFVFDGACWANVSNTPFRLYKQKIHEGGITTPAIMHWPAGISADLQGKLITTPAHVIDIMPTSLTITGTSYPRNADLTPIEGIDLSPLFSGQDIQRTEPLFFEHNGNKGVRLGRWKLVTLKGKGWELYDVSNDRTENHNLAAVQPELVKELSELYQAWAQRCLVTKTRRGK